jgi:tetratricopeptide (TPR) repeat protein
MQRRQWILCAAVAAVAAGLYLHTLAFDFVFDDEHLIVNNAFLKEPWSPLRAFAHHFWHGTPYGVGYYRPIVISSFALNGRQLGWGPLGFHLINVLLHAVNASLLFVLARRLRFPAWAAALTAALFAVHPVAAWPVGSIVARVDLLPALFVLLAWRAYVSLRECDPMTPRADLVRAGWLGLFFLCALLSKESAVAFLAIPIMGLRRMKTRGEGSSGREGGARVAWIGLASVLLVLLIYLGMRTAAGIGLNISSDPITNPLAHLPLPDRTLAALRLCGRYLLYLLAPVRFSDPSDYARGWRPLSPVDPWVMGSAALLLTWIVGTLVLWWRRERLSIPLAFALGSFLPASNLLLPIASLYAVNFLYMPLIGFCLVLGDLLLRLPADDAVPPETVPRTAKKVLFAATPILVLMAVGSGAEASIWHDRIALFTDWTRRFPRYSLSHSSLGVTLLRQDKNEEAIKDFRKALDLDDRNMEAHFNLGAALVLSSSAKETLQEALVETRRALELSPNMVPAHGNASKILLDLGRPAEAEAEAREALRLIPDYLPARRNLAEALFREDRYREAAAEFKALTQIDPTDPDLRSPFVVSLLKAGDLEEARWQTEAARRAFPDLAWFDFCLARVEARSSRRAEALALLRNSLARDPATRDWIGKVPDFDSYRSSSEFEALLAPDGGGAGPDRKDPSNPENE